MLDIPKKSVCGPCLLVILIQMIKHPLAEKGQRFYKMMI